MLYICDIHTNMQAAIKNGPNGTSLFIVNPRENFCETNVGVNLFTNSFQNTDENAINPRPTIAPVMNARSTALMPPCGPKSQPMPSASFESPSPIHFPTETSHKAKSGSATAGPARIGHRV